MSDIPSHTRVNFIEYNAKLNTLAARRVFPKYGTPLLATILKQKGYDVAVYLEGTSRMDFETMTDCDVVCFPLFAPAYNKVKECAMRIMKEKPGISVIIGGPHVIMFPETVLDFCHYAVCCEGDEVLPELIKCIMNRGDIERVQGIMFKKDRGIVKTPSRVPPVIPSIIPDMTLIRGFKRMTLGIGRLYNIQNTLQTSRGCHYKCSFCPTQKLFGGVYRNRDIDSIIAEIKDKQRYNDWFFVVDNSFFGNREKTKLLLNRLIKENLGATLIVFEREEIGHDEETLALLKKAGVQCLIVGVESLVDANLKAFNKKQTSADVVWSLHNIKKSGIHVIGTFAFGYDGDTKEKARELVQFIRQNNLSLNVFILHDIKREDDGTLLVPLNRRFMTYYQMTDPSNSSYADYMTGSFITYFPKKMKPSTLQRIIIDIYNDVYTHGYILKSVFKKNVFDSLFGIVHGYGIRRMNESIARVADGYYIDYLKKIEDGLYDESENLIEEKLHGLKGLPLPKPLEEQNDLRSYDIAMQLALAPGMVRYLLHKLVWRVGKSVQTTRLASQPTSI